MSFRIHCNCGWTNQVSEFYLGDRITCPDCGAKVEVHQNSGVPYGYPPYPTWQKKLPAPRAPVYLPSKRRTLFPTYKDPHAGPAFWLGFGSLLLSISMCGLVPGFLMALFGLRSAYLSHRFSKDHGKKLGAGTKMGLGMSLLSLLVAGLMLLAMFTSKTHCTRPPHRHRPPAIRMAPEKPHPQQDVRAPSYRYEKPDADFYEKQRQQSQDAIDAWNRIHSTPYRYNSNPEPQPVRPRNDFQRSQQRYSNRVREARRSGAPMPPRPSVPSPQGYRYGK
jgi:hypothetical protein